MPATSTATATRFNPRPLVRRDSGERPGNLHHQVSTHAPLAGSDASWTIRTMPPPGFNPRSPCGERRPAASTRPSARSFNPRSPWGERRSTTTHRSTDARFNPRSPCGERLHRQIVKGRGTRFNPRSPCGERRRWIGCTRYGSSFNPRSPCGERLRVPHRR